MIESRIGEQTDKQTLWEEERANKKQKGELGGIFPLKFCAMAKEKMGR